MTSDDCAEKAERYREISVNTLAHNERLMKENERLEAENARLRTAVATAIRVQTVLCGDADMAYCRESCPLHRPETDDCVACDVIRAARELGIEVE